MMVAFFHFTASGESVFAKILQLLNVPGARESGGALFAMFTRRIL